MHSRRILGLAAACLVAFALGAPARAADPAPAQDTWNELKFDLVGDRPLIADGLIVIEAPDRAEDAAIVPVTVRATRSQAEGARIEKITLVVDENPAPVAAIFTFGPSVSNATISTRVRIDAFSWIHAIAETSDGAIHVADVYVKAAGGCSAPAGKDAEQALAHLGKMRIKDRVARAIQGAAKTDGPQSQPHLATIMIRHPNFSGLQKDPVTQHFIPARYVRDIEVRQGDELVLGVEGAISMSEDPNISFQYVPNGAGELHVRAVDTDGAVFDGRWPVSSGHGS